MSEYQILVGDCVERLKELPDNSVDAVVTDPPYGLSKQPDMAEVMRHWLNGDDYQHKGAGFMGKSWDSFVPGPSVWRECFRVLKPGGHLLAFFGSRTYDIGTLAIRLAGFEVRDQIMWVYGCLSEDTDIVTPDGQKSYTSIKTGDLVLCYDKYNQEYSYQPVEEVYEYNIKDTAYRIQSDHTDQIVSRNHRTLVERGGEEVFVFAEELNSEENIPFLEDLPSLQQAISDSHKGTSNQKKNLFKEMLKPANWFGEQWGETLIRAFRGNSSNLCSLQDYILPKQKTFGEGENTSLFSKMQWSFAWEGMETTCPQGEKKLEARVGAGVGGKNDRRNQSSLEGWSDLQTTEGELQRGKVCSLPKRIFENGKKRWLHNGTSFADGATVGEIADQRRGCASHRSQSTQQQHKQSDAFCKQLGSQTVRTWKGHKTTLATVTPFEYEGKIWCVKVPTGSFVAVRNGKAFTTGNSGFPKSMDISKAIDKAAGAEREVMGTVDPRSKFDGRERSSSAINTNWRQAEFRDDVRDLSKKELTAPATPEAQQWQGWGTALKPAHEPIVMARKPISGTVASNVLEHGTGAINIDGCRVAPAGEHLGGGSEKAETAESFNKEGWERPWQSDEALLGAHAEKVRLNVEKASSLGRFPANFIHDGSDEVVGLFPMSKSPSPYSGKPYKNTSMLGVGGVNHDCEYGDKGSAARFFYCAKASKRDRDEGLAGFDGKSAGELTGGRKEGSAGLNNPRAGAGRTSSGRKNVHPTVKPTDLMRYLVRMVTPPSGTVLDPFTGSGSTGKACMIEGFNFVGCELSDEYAEIAKARIEHAKNVEPEKENRNNNSMPPDIFE